MGLVWNCLLCLLFRLVFLRPAMLIAMEAGCGEIIQIVGATVHQGFPVFNGGAGRTVLRKRPLTIAALTSLELYETPAYPHSIQRIPQALHNLTNCSGLLRRSNFKRN